MLEEARPVSVPGLRRQEGPGEITFPLPLGKLKPGTPAPSPHPPAWSPRATWARDHVREPGAETRGLHSRGGSTESSLYGGAC